MSIRENMSEQEWAEIPKTELADEVRSLRRQLAEVSDKSVAALKDLKVANIELDRKLIESQAQAERMRGALAFYADVPGYDFDDGVQARTALAIISSAALSSALAEERARVWIRAATIARGTIIQDKGFGGEEPSFWRAGEHLAKLYENEAETQEK